MISTTKTIILLALCFASLTSLAQDADFSLVSVNANFETANAVAMDSETSAIYVGGIIEDGSDVGDFLGNESNGNGIASHSLQGGGSEDCYLAKLSYDGEILWLITFGSDESDELFDVQIGPDYNVYITGAFAKSFTIPSADESLFQDVSHVHSSSDFDMFTASFTPDGVVRWVKVDGGEGDDKGLALDVGIDGVAVLGAYNSWSNSFAIGGMTNGYSSGTADYAVTKRDFEGNALWVATMGSTSQDFDFDEPFCENRVGLTCDGDDVYVMAKWSGPECFFYNASGVEQIGHSLPSSDGEFDFFVAKINSSGSFDWTQPFYSDYSGTSRSCAIDVDCNAVYVAGIMDADASNWLWFPSGYIWSWGNASELFIASLDKSTGVDNWFEMCYDEGDATELAAIRTSNNGNLVVVGSLDGDLYLPDGFNVNSVSSEDALILEFNTEGTCMDAFVLGDSGKTFAHSADIDNEGNCCVVGITDDNWVDGTSSSENSFVHAFELKGSGISPCCTSAAISGWVTVSDSNPCPGSVVEVELSGYYGNIQWIYSADGGATWSVPSGFTDDSYSVPVWSDVLIRAIVSVPGCSSSSSNVISINVQDIEISCPTGMTYGVDNTCTYIMEDQISPNTELGCDATGFTQIPAVGTALGIGETTCFIISPGGDLFCSFPITVVDDQAPEIVCPINQSIIPNASCEYVVDDYTNTLWASDNCSNNITISQSPAPGTIVFNTTEITVFAEDEVGNTNSCSFDANLIEPIGSLSVICPGNQVLEVADDCSAVLPDYTSGFVTSSCGAASVTQSPIAGSILSGGQTVNLTAIDVFGTTESCDFEVSIVDNLAPTIVCPGNAALAPNEDCDFVVPDYLNDVTVFDNCDSNIELIQTPAAGTIITAATPVTITATDDANNSSSCSFTLTVAMVVEFGPPNCPGDQNVVLDENCEFVLPNYSGFNPGSTDCGLTTSIVFQSPPAGTIVNSDTEVFLSANSTFNPLLTCSFWVLAEDQSSPVFDTCPEDIIVDLEDDCTFVIGDYLSLASATDNCDSDLTYTQLPGAGIKSDESTTVIITATDDAGNSSQCEFKLIPQDNTAPVVDCIEDQTRSLDASCGYSIEDFSALIATSDNCGTPTIVQTPSPGTLIQNSQNVFFVVSDDSGNSTVCQFFLSLVDDTTPTLDCPTEITLQADENCQITIPDFEELVTYSDNCGMNSFVQDFVPGVLVDAVPFVVNMKAEDPSGLGEQCEVSILVEDVIPPSIICPGDLMVAANDNCQFVLPDYGISVIVSDNCSSVDVSQSIAPGSVLNTGTYTIELEASDDSGLTESCSFELTVQDVSIPTITCLGDQSVSANSDCKGLLPDYASTMSITDNCGVSAIVQTPEAGATITGTTVVTIDVVDDSGLTNSCSFTVLLEDTESPSIDCPEDQIIYLEESCSAIVPDYLASANVSDNCGLFSVVQSPAAGTEIFSSTVVLIQVTDDSGYVSQCEFDLALQDIGPPEIICPDDQEIMALNCQATLPDYSLIATVFDHCGIATVNQIPAAGTDLSIGSHTIELIVEDANGLITTCSFEIEVINSDQPSFNCPDQVTREVSNACEYALEDFMNQLSDEESCSALTYSQSPSVGTMLSVGDHTIEISASDVWGNSFTCSFILEVEDTTLPAVFAEDVVAITNADCVYVLPDLVPDLVATDNCSIASIEQLPSPGTELSAGNSEVVFLVIDASGNSVYHPIDVNVVDGNGPQFLNCPDQQELILDDACQVSLPDYTSLLEVGFCTGVEVDYTLTQSPAPGTMLTESTQVVIGMTDLIGNYDECSFEVQLIDNQAPEIDCSVFNPVNFLTTNCLILVPDFEAQLVVTDNCDLEMTFSQFPEAGSLIAPEENLVSIVVADQSGNSTTCEVHMEGIDVSAPTATLIANEFHFSVDDVCKYTLVDETANVNAEDGCGEITIVQTPPAGTILSVGDYVLQFDVTDATGNLTTLFADLFVEDDTAPVISMCPEDHVVEAVDNCEAVLADYSLSFFVMDNCTVLEDLEIIQTPSVGTIITGQQEVLLEVFDSTGNSASCTLTVSVEDTENPIVFCPQTTIDVFASTDCEFVIEDFSSLINTTDNCEVVSVEQSPVEGTAVGFGIHEITFEVTDAQGNVGECSFDINVLDNSAPSQLDFPPVLEVTTDENCQAILPDLTALVGVGQECSDFSITQTPFEGTVLTDPSIVVSITVADVSGNESVIEVEVVLIDSVDPIFVDAPTLLEIEVGDDCNYVLPNILELVEVSDNCSSLADLNIEQSPDAGEILNVETIVTITATDEAGNSAEIDVTIVPNDGSSPILSCGLDGTQIEADLNCQAVLVDYTDEIESVEDCSTVSLSQSPEPGSILALGSHEIWIIAVDAQFNTDSCSFVLEVIDVSPPFADFEIENQVLIANSDCVASMPLMMEEFMATDNCDSDLTVVQFPEAGTQLGIGSHPASITYMDDAGNSIIESFLVMVEDQTAPVVVCPEPLQVDLTLGCTFQLSDFTSLIQVEDCSPYTISQNPSVGSIISESTELTFLIIDDIGMESTCSLFISLTDIASPQIACLEDQVITVSSSCEMVVPDYTTSVEVEDNCTVAEFVQTPEPGTLVSAGEVVDILLEVFDNAGNDASCSFELTFEDTLAPQIICPSDLVLEANEFCETTLLIEFESFEDCEELNITQLSGPENGSTVSVGSYDVEFLISDAAGNEIICELSVEVVDVTAPSIECPADITSCDPTVFFDPISAADNCGDVEITQVDHLDLHSGSQFPLGTTEITYQAEDQFGNSSFCTLSITIMENVEIDLSQIPETICENSDELNLEELLSTSAAITWDLPIDQDGLLNANDLSFGVNTLSFSATLNSCSSSFDFEIDLIVTPDVNAGPDQQVCGTLAELEGTASEGTYNWSVDGDALFVSAQNELSAVVEATEFGTQTFTLSVSNQGCSASDNVAIEFFEQPEVPEAGIDQLLNYVNDTQLAGEYSGPGTIDWWTATSSCTILHPNDLNSHVSNLDVGENLVYLTVSNGPCPSTMDSLLITVNDLLIPSGFSPNGDMDNDYLVVDGLIDWPGSKLIVFNRWGNEVYSNDDYQNDWDGTGKDGNLLPDDTYFMILQAAGVEHKGYLVIKR